LVVLAVLVAGLSGCDRSSSVQGEGGADSGLACVAQEYCAGAAKVVVSPSQAQIDGIIESRLFIGSKAQQFNLGGYGINPIQNLPSPFADFSSSLTQPAQLPVHRSSRFDEDEHTWLRLMVLQQGETRVAFVTLDAIGAGNLIQQGLRDAVVEASCALDWCIEADNIVFGQTRSHAGADLQGLWGGVPEDWIENILYAGAAQATREAVSTRRLVNAEFGQGYSRDFNKYRRPQVNTAAETDDAASLLRFRDPRSGRSVAQLLQYAAHPTSIDEDPRIPHADYIYGAMRRLERSGGVALYFNGPIADASPAGGDCRFKEPDAYERVRCRGDALAAFSMAQPMRRLMPELSIRHRSVILPATNPLFAAAAPLGAFNRYYDFTPRLLTSIPVLGDILGTAITEVGQVPLTAETLVTRVSLGGAGGLEIATIPGEATNSFGQFIRGLAAQANPQAGVMLFGLTQNSFGYILPEEEFSYIDASGDAGFLVPFTGYEEFVSLGPLTAPLLRMQGYLPLFDAEPIEYLPSYLRACAAPGSGDCLIAEIARDLEYIQTQFAQRCLEANAPAAFCELLDPQTPLAGLCGTLRLPPDLCGLFGDAAVAP
jgi:hypothetical protein